MREIPFRGNSMYPCIRDGETISARFFDAPKSLADFTEGTILLHHDGQELMVHRLVNGRLKADWSNRDWPGPVIGELVTIQTRSAQSMAGLFSLFSKLTGSDSRPVRWLGKIGLFTTFLIREVRG